MVIFMANYYIDFEANIDNTILTIGAVGDNGYEFSAAIKPQKPIHWSITKITGITDKDAEAFSSIDSVIENIDNNLLNAINKNQLFCYGHNDFNFIRATRNLFEKDTYNYNILNQLYKKLVNIDSKVSNIFNCGASNNKISIRNAYATMCRDLDLTPTMLHQKNHNSLTDAKMLCWIMETIANGYTFNAKNNIVRVPKIFSQSAAKIAEIEKAEINLPEWAKNHPVWVTTIRKTNKVKISNYNNLANAVKCYRNSNKNPGELSVMVERAYQAAVNGTPYMGRIWSFKEIAMNSI